MRRLRGLRAWGLGILLTSTEAYSAPPGALDAVSLPTPTSPSRFASLETTHSLGHRTLTSGARLSYLRAPLVLRTPSPSPEGTSAPALENVLAAEILLAGGFGPSFDVGFGLPMRIYQNGSGLGPIGQSPLVRSPALADPRLFIGYAMALSEEWNLRPYGALYLPLATRNAFGGGASTRGVLGLSSSYGESSLVSLDASILLAESVTVGLTEWGSLAKLGLGYSASLREDTSVSFEAAFGLPLVGQLAPLGGEAATLLSTELLGTIRHRLDAHELGLILGVGLPTSRTSSLSGNEFVRAPSTPSLRLAFEYRFEQSPKAARALR